MKDRIKSALLCGPLAAVVLVVILVALPRLVPGYDSVRQTVSEIGEVGSPARVPFTAALCAVSLCLVLVAVGAARVATSNGRSAWPSYLIACMAVSSAGVGLFAFPHPLHNVFGMSEVVGYQAPLAMALAWRRAPRARALVAFSWVMWVVVLAALGANLVTLARASALWMQVRPVYGLVQRSLFAAWFVWCAGAGWALARLHESQRAEAPDRES